MQLEELAKLRARLQRDVSAHEISVQFFADHRDHSFYRSVADKAAPRLHDGTAHRLTTTLTCYESLLEAQLDPEVRARVLEDLRAFSLYALSRPPDEWRSDGAATVYCRVRTLAPLLRIVEDLPEEDLQRAGARLGEAWRGVEARSDEDGIYENAESNAPYENRYPPNAYLSYWGMAAMNAAELHDCNVPDFQRKKDILTSWFEKTIGTQVALHYGSSSRSDPHQLCWAICGALISSDRPLPERSGAIDDLVRAGLAALFAQQQEDGAWSRGEPLFHYPNAGNAYCYVFETFGELMALATRPSRYQASLSTQLLQYADELVKLYDFAIRTRRTLDGGPGLGWASGHHPHRNTPESWATASAYRFFQRFRRLVGQWTTATAKASLGARVPREGLETIAERGDSWDAGFGSAGVQLASMFVHPLRALPQPSDPDPDAPFIDLAVARSAILYGPPGTSKTTLVESVAGALGWDFIEVTSAQFLDRGVEFVSARADEIFRQLMEVDHCVVLLDEIDELIRSRVDKADPLERFFTTTMLPRLAKLWSQRRILFFVNTNAIQYVDAAVRRSQRFDAAIFVLPPSLQQKRDLLGDKLEDAQASEAERLLTGALTVANAGDRAEIGWLGLVRYDQLSRLRELAQSKELLEALRAIGDDLRRTDWLTQEGGMATLTEVLGQTTELANNQRRDDGARASLMALEDVSLTPPEGVEEVRTEAGTFWKVSPTVRSLNLWARDKRFVFDAAARIMGQLSEERGSDQ